MLFNSTTFLIFFSVVYLLYLGLNHGWQNRLLLAASLVFYGWWDARFLALIMFSIGLDFVCGRKIHATSSLRRRRFWLAVSLAGNLGMLGVFKYFHFFVQSLADLLTAIGLKAHGPTLEIILPIGISFYTFQTLSYTIDIYRRRMQPTERFLEFALFVSFFPQLLAGPIERAHNLLPQIIRERTVTPALIGEGVHLIAWGLFKKMFVADTIAPVVNSIFANSGQASPADVVLALYAFSIQLYCDFSGYSDIARGLGKMMGFHIMVNFRFPQFAENLTDFWNRWHISLSTWVRDYLYQSLGAAAGGRLKGAANLILTMAVIGLWHGASWTFVLWGLFFGLIQVGYGLWKSFRPPPRKSARPNDLGRKILRIVFCRIAVVFSLLLFRSENIGQVAEMFQGLFRNTGVLPNFFVFLKLTLIAYTPVFIYEFWQYLHDDALILLKQKDWVRFLVWVALVFSGYLIYLFSANVPVGEEFIYFQF